MPPDPRDPKGFWKPLGSIFALVVPLCVGYLVYFQWRTPALDCTLDWQTGIVLDVPQESYANYAGIQPGDVILTVNGVPFRTWDNIEIENRAVEVRRGDEVLTLELPILTLAQVQLPYLVSAIVVALAFSLLGTFLLWRRPRQVEARLFFWSVQSVAIGLLFFLAFPNLLLRPYWMEVASVVGLHIAGALVVHYYLTFPVVLGTPQQRRRLLSIVYSLMLVALACRLSNTDLGTRLSFVYNTSEIMGALALLIYVYLRRATPDGKRRLRLIVFGGLVAALPSFFFYLIPTILGSSYRMPGWMVGPLLIVFPLTYALAIVRHNLFDIDRILNRAIVYLIIAFGIWLLYLAPFLLIFWLLPGDWLAQIFIAAGLTLLVGVGFDWTRKRVQQRVDRLFYGGWYDYPGVVETISDALARSIERAELTDVLTRQVPSLMQLEPGQLAIGDAVVAPIPMQQPLALSLPLAFQGQTRAVWLVGARRDGEELTAGDRRILNTLARQAQVTLGNVLLVEMLRQQLDEIRASQETLARAQRQLLRSREEERARLARDLHDGPIQELVGLNMQLGLALTSASSPLADALTAMRGEVRALLSDLRHVCAELRPPMLDTMGLGAALRVLADDWSKQTGLAVQIALPPDATLRALSGEVSVNLYRLAQEALTNIARHAAAHQVAIQAEWRGQQLALTIRDDGRGFVVPSTFHDLAAQGHFGLVGMQERATLIGATLSVQSAPGQGTCLQILVAC